MIKSTGIDFFTFYATTAAEKCNHQLVVATTGAFTLISVNLMLVQFMIASHAEVWTCQFWWKFYQELTVTTVQVPEGTAVSTTGHHYVQ